jgi:hypothetical protein
VRTTYREVVGRVFPALETAASSADTFPTMLTAMLEAALEAVAEYPDLAGLTTAVGVAGGEHPELHGLHEAAMGAQWRTVERLVQRARQRTASRSHRPHGVDMPRPSPRS